MASNNNTPTACQLDTHLNQSISDQISNSENEEHSNITSANIDNHQIMNEEERLKEEKFNLELDKLNIDLQLKPKHWSDEYWKDILNKYRWFLHKNDLAGCKICYNVKVFVGKKSLLASMKLFIMNLSYDEFEQKLAFHHSTNQHAKCEEYLKQDIDAYTKKEEIVHLKTFPRKMNEKEEVHLKTLPRKINEKEEVVHLKTLPRKINEKEEVVHLKTLTRIMNESKSSEYNCPQCNKTYKFKKSLATHLYTCDPTIQETVHFVPCNCSIQNIHSLSFLDQHVTSVHADQYRYTCHICSLELSKTTNLFEHLFLKHDFLWNPYKESPLVKLGEEVINLSNMREDGVNSSNGNLENCYFDSVGDVKRGKKRVFKEISQGNLLNSFKKPMQETTNFCSSNSVTIDRYLSETVLKSHMERYHPE